MLVSGSHLFGGLDAKKLQALLELVKAQPGLETAIFSGLQPGALKAALLGAHLRTRILLKPTVYALPPF